MISTTSSIRRHGSFPKRCAALGKSTALEVAYIIDGVGYRWTGEASWWAAMKDSIERMINPDYRQRALKTMRAHKESIDRVRRKEIEWAAILADDRAFIRANNATARREAASAIPDISRWIVSPDEYTPEWSWMQGAVNNAIRIAADRVRTSVRPRILEMAFARISNLAAGLASSPKWQTSKSNAEREAAARAYVRQEVGFSATDLVQRIMRETKSIESETMQPGRRSRRTTE